MSDNMQKVGYLAVGAVVGGLLAFGALHALDGDEDEDRPPIIVRGGSLIFQSGDPADNDPDYTNGKPWRQVGSDWQPDHKKGKKLKWFSVQLSASNQATCPFLSMTKEVTITYRKADGTEATFTITAKPRNGSSGSAAPAITGTGVTLVQGGTAQNPQLIYGGDGTISNVRFQAQGVGNVNCTTASVVKVWQH